MKTREIISDSTRKLSNSFGLPQWSYNDLRLVRRSPGYWLLEDTRTPGAVRDLRDMYQCVFAYPDEDLHPGMDLYVPKVGGIDFYTLVMPWLQENYDLLMKMVHREEEWKGQFLTIREYFSDFQLQYRADLDGPQQSMGDGVDAFDYTDEDGHQREVWSGTPLFYHLMSRQLQHEQELLEAYFPDIAQKVGDLVGESNLDEHYHITIPGPYWGQPYYVPYFWEQAKGTGICLYKNPSGREILRFTIKLAESRAFPELQPDDVLYICHQPNEKVEVTDAKACQRFIGG